MLPSDSRNERSPLRAVTNTANSPLTRKAGSTPVKKATSNMQKASLPRMSLPMPPSDAMDKGSDKQKKPRPSLNKRVSFGGNSINVFYKQSEFSPQENEPAVKAPRTLSRSSPAPQRSPSFSRSDSRLLLRLPASEGVSEDTVSMPSVPKLPEDSFFPDQDPSPPANENPSPVPVRRGSIGLNNRQSLGLFIDEDVTVGKRDIINGDQEDMTIELPRMNSASKARRMSNASVLSDGDITQSLYAMIPKMLDDEDLCDDNDSSDVATGQSSSPNFFADANPEEAGMKMDGIVQHEGSEPVPGYDASEPPFTENENEALKSGNTSSSEMDAIPAEQEGAQENSKEPMSNSPGVDDPNESAECSSPAVPVRVRPVPPNRRKLFDSDGNDDEDNTLHYHDQPGRAADDTRSIQRKPLGVLSALPSTPLPASQIKLRSVIEERVPTSGKRNAASKLRELSSSAIRSSQPGVVTSEGEGVAEKSFNFRDFLQAVQLNFDRKAETRQRGQSLGPQNYPTDNFDRSSLEGEVVESIRKETVLATFTQQIETLRAKIAQDNHNIEVLERQLEATRPPLFSKMAELEALPIHETTTYRVSMKRLRKLSTLKNKEEWVTGRQVWEKDLGGVLKAAIAALGQDNISLCDSKEEHRAANSLFIEQVAGLGLGAAFTEEQPDNDSTEEDNKERAAFIQEMSIYRDMRGYVNSLMHEEEDLKARRESAAPLRMSLLAACKELRMNASASSERSVRKMITERVELNSIVSGISGVNLTRVNKNSISLRAFDMMDIQFSLHDEKVINTSCKTIAPSTEESCPTWQRYVDGAVSLVNWNGGVKNVKYVRDISSALYRCTSALRQARLVYEDASFYLNRNIGRIVSGGLRHSEGAPCLDLAVEASFYSLRLRSKFDVIVTVTTRLPISGSAYFAQEATIEKVHRYFGDKPEDQVIFKVLIESGRRDLGVYSLADGLAGIWRSLN